MPDKHIIIGDGVAGATAAEIIREENEDADIKIFTDESEPLYNRIMLKTYMKGRLPKQYTRMHDENWYEKRGIDLHLETRVAEVDTDAKAVETEDGNSHSYDKLLVATGGSPRELPQDEDYENLHYMWTMQDADHIKNAAEESETAVVIGGGLLGIDLAVAFAENDCETYYLIREENWWSRGLDPEGAVIIHGKLEEKGVNIVTETEVERLEAEEGRVTEVLDSSGKTYECDAVAVAIGQTPNSGIIDVEKNGPGMIQVDEKLQSSEPDVYAAGNMVEYTSPVFGSGTVRGSWDHSEAMGDTAGKNMAGGDEEFDYVNTYGVGHFDVQFLAIGDWSGDPVSKKYSEDEYRRLFFRDDKLVGAVMIGYTGRQEKIKDMIAKAENVGDRSSLIEKTG